MKKKSGGGMPYFHKEHWEKSEGEPMVSDLRYTSKDSMANAEHLKKSVDGLSSYVKKNKMNYP